MTAVIDFGTVLREHPRASAADVSNWHAATLYVSEHLPADEHDNDCPVKHGASSSCCWPIAVCVPADWARPWSGGTA